MNTSEVTPLFNTEISDMHQSDDLGEMVEVDLSSDEFIHSDFDREMRYDYCAEDVQLAIKMGDCQEVCRVFGVEIFPFMMQRFLLVCGFIFFSFLKPLFK